jgi:hypothetical protein
MTMPISTEIGVTAPLTASTTASPMTQPKMGIFVPPLTAGIPVSTSIPKSPHPKVRARLDGRFITVQNLSREQPYGMPTSMMANLHNIASTFADHANSFTSYNTHSPSSSSIFDRNAPPTLTIESMISLRQQMDESNHVMVNMHVNTMNWYSF